PAPPALADGGGARTRGPNWQGFRSLSRATFRGFVRDRAALFFTILFPVLFLLLFGSIYKSSSTPKINVVEVGRVSVLEQARAGSHGQLDKVLTVTHTTSLSHALNEVRQATVDAAVQQQGGRLIVHYSIAIPAAGGVVESVCAGTVQAGNQAASGRPPAYQLAPQRVEDKSLKPIQYLTPGLLGWAIASGGAFGAALTLVGWRKNKLLRRLRLAPVGTASIVSARIPVSVTVA